MSDKRRGCSCASGGCACLFGFLLGTLWLAQGLGSENAVDIVWHTGGAGGSSSDVAFTKHPKVGVVVLANSSADVSTLGDTVLYLLHLH